MAEYRVGGAVCFPFLPCEIHIIQPAFIYIYDPFSFSQKFYHLFGKHHTEDQALFRVCIVWYTLDSFEFKSEILTKNIWYQFWLNVQLTIRLNQLNDLLDIIDDLILLKQLLCLLLYGLTMILNQLLFAQQFS